MECIINEEKSVGNFWIFCGYVMALLGGMIGLLVGSHLLKNDITARGQKIYRFDETSRRHGKTIVTLACVVITFGLFLNLSLKV